MDACHSHGLAVLLDVVYNHLGPDGNYLNDFSPDYFTDRYKTGWGAAINYDGPHSDGVRRFVIDNALMWLRDYGFDGLRLDAVHAIFCFEAIHVLEELANAVKRLGEELNRPLTLIAEGDLNDPRLCRTVCGNGNEFVDGFAAGNMTFAHRNDPGEIDGYYADFRGYEMWPRRCGMATYTRAVFSASGSPAWQATHRLAASTGGECAES